MPVHKDVLKAANELSDARGRFRVDAVVRRLTRLNQTTVRTHVTSRCCVNAPQHHATKLPYFRRVGRGEYEILKPYRAPLASVADVAQRTDSNVSQPQNASPARNAIHALMTFGDGWYTAECLEIAAVTQGRTLDDAVRNLREAIALHLEGSIYHPLGDSGTGTHLVISCELLLEP